MTERVFSDDRPGQFILSEWHQPGYGRYSGFADAPLRIGEVLQISPQSPAYSWYVPVINIPGLQPSADERPAWMRAKAGECSLARKQQNQRVWAFLHKLALQDMRVVPYDGTGRIVGIAIHAAAEGDRVAFLAVEAEVKRLLLYSNELTSGEITDNVIAGLKDLWIQVR
ncbi:MULTISPECIES: hypothetical protein [unclassified Mesorhizobium]|uniref:hypothetical protein n=1 Tax=unclassified Mesorhizobium TaxID=325217 RepID=UPI00109259CA|nr:MULTISPECIES: hypothetical protein [unclassified Mesorhizobium]TGQ01413.1 hypothetical protein EN861_01470 [Mesorhizobium sp. M8A.F.Ca.ET.218.01.1.1]TGT20686.1 hypothetical protein EN856_01475 [Mesorhizobium sp. M8A.F.Ca.ET.213.01.1.1]